jgi:hypothetical protein
VEVNYTPTPNETTPSIASPGQLTIGGGSFLPSADQTNTSGDVTAESVDISSDVADSVWISHDGKTIACEGCSGFQASVAGGPAQSAVGDTLTFATPVTAGQPVQVTIPDPFAAENTQLNVSVPGPQMSLVEQPLPTAPADTAPEEYVITGLPSCDAYLVIDEVVCHNVTPGSYTLSDGSQTTPITVPAAIVMPPKNGDALQSLFVPSEAGAVVPGLAGGQTVTLSQNDHVVTRLTVDPLRLASNQPLGDLLNGANAITTGTCNPGVFIQDGTDNPDLCTLAGALPAVNNLTGLATSLTQNDESSPGSTAVMLPQFALQQPANGASVFTPFSVSAQLRYTDPLAQAAQENTPAPELGARPVIPSTSSNDKAVFSYAPLGTGKFRTLGNANVAGGVQLPPTLRIGAYDGRWTVTDAAGDSYTRDIMFYNQGATSGTLAAPKCTVAVNRGGHATIARGKGRSSKGRIATFRCTAQTGAHIALWIERGTTVVGDGSGTARHGRATITISGGLKSGVYQLIEVINLNGQSGQTNRTLKLS